MNVKLVLLGVAAVIIVGIIWDAVRNRKGKIYSVRVASGKEPEMLEADELGDEIIAVRSSTRIDNEQSETTPTAIHTRTSSNSLSMPVTVIDRTQVDVTGKRSTFTKTAYAKDKTKHAMTKEATSDSRSASAESPAHSIKNDLVVLHVMSKGPQLFKGKSLNLIFNELHLKFGDMNIFHLYEQIDGSGEIIFSIASAIEPGYFVNASLENLETPGLVLFFTLTHPHQSISAFEMMYRIAKQIALRLEGEVMDEFRRPLSTQKIEQYRERVRNFPMIESA